jgi:hypothetical protein
MMVLHFKRSLALAWEKVLHQRAFLFGTLDAP